MSMEKLITGEKIVKSYGNGSEKNIVLNGVSVTIDKGEFVAVMGPSGSGKTTLLYALSWMDGIDEGEVCFCDAPLSGLREDELADLRRKEMGFVFQQPTLLKNLNLLDNIVLPALRDNPKSGKVLAKKAQSLMSKMGIGELSERGVTQVSGGQLQRAGICRALINDPKIIFGDEPTGALNSKSAQEIMDLLTSINNSGTAILLVTHDARVAARAQRVLFMRDGNIVSTVNLSSFTSDNFEEKVECVSEKMRDIEI